MRSHLLPRALTRPSIRGNRLIQTGGSNSPPKSRWDSWYDDDLVTVEGEEILARYDSWAIQELTRLKLIWKSWGPTTSFRDSLTASPGLPSFGLRRVNWTNPAMLRLFFLSLLWRAGATDRVEFQGVQLDQEDLSRLQRMVRDGDPSPLSFYPTTLMQIASRGPAHNLVPIAIDETVDMHDGMEHRYYVFRFYFDGLIANMHRSMANVEELSAFIVGGSNDMVVQMQLFDDSFQLANLRRSVAESVSRWPEASSRLPRKARE